MMSYKTAACDLRSATNTDYLTLKFSEMMSQRNGLTSWIKAIEASF